MRLFLKDPSRRVGDRVVMEPRIWKLGGGKEF